MLQAALPSRHGRLVDAEVFAEVGLRQSHLRPQQGNFSWPVRHLLFVSSCFRLQSLGSQTPPCRRKTPEATQTRLADPLAIEQATMNATTQCFVTLRDPK